MKCLITDLIRLTNAHFIMSVWVFWLSLLYASGRLSFACARHRSGGLLWSPSCGLEGSLSTMLAWGDRSSLQPEAHHQAMADRLELEAEFNRAGRLSPYSKAFAPAVADPAAVPEPAAVAESEGGEEQQSDNPQSGDEEDADHVSVAESRSQPGVIASS